LTNTSTNLPFTGRAKAVFIFGQSDRSISVISTVIAKECDQKNGARIRFIGSSSFDKKTQKHIVETILPLVDEIFKALGLPEKRFELSIVNLDVASMSDIGLTVSGFSADVPIVLALLSAGLKISVPGDIVSTGHIASTDGDIRMVKEIPAKLTAAIKFDSICTFVHPAIDVDNSLDSFSPDEKHHINDALNSARRDIKTIGVRNIDELVRTVFSDNRVVLASLRQGFYHKPASLCITDTPSGRAAKFFCENNEQRFWKVLELQMLSGKSNKVKELLTALTLFYFRQKSYPKELGGKLNNLVQSLPPETLRFKIDFPLLGMSECLRLSKFAQESDHEDVRLLFSASFGEKNRQKADWKVSSQALSYDQDEKKLQLMLSEIDSDALAKFVGLPIDSARASYIMDSVIVRSSDGFNQTVTSFYIHLLRHTRKISGSFNSKVAGAEAFAILEKVFSQRGGLAGALVEAKNAANGGLRLVLDLMTEQFKRDEKEKHINGILKSVMDPLDWQGKVSLMKKILKHFELHLPPEIIAQPPERFAAHYESIVRAYVKSVDQVKTLFRSF
jgi:hypothetical protein